MATGPDSNAAWTSYWQGAGRGAGCLPGAPPALAEALRRGWSDFAMALPEQGTALDLCTGSGAVVAAMRAARADLAVTGIDRAALPAGEAGLIGGIDAGALPFGDAAFDGVSSQFGVEYCGEAALDEAARVLRPGGRLRLVVHHAASPALAHNRQRRAAIDALRGAGLFAIGRDAALGRRPEPAREAALDAAQARFAGQSIVQELPAAVGQALRGPNPLIAVSALERKAAMESARLAAMAAAARDAAGIAAMAARLEAGGVGAEVAVLRTGGAEDAWVIAGARRGAC